MKRCVLFILSLLLLSFGLQARVSALSPEDIISDAAVLMDAQTGQVLFSKNGDAKMFPASTTKIMTGLLIAESLGMNQVATVTESAVDIDEWDSANIGLVPGEKMQVGELMYAMMLPSANDAANVLAEHAAGNQNDFAQKMTERARSLGAVNTRFANAHGLSDPNHYTTAYDLALITRAAIKNPVFMEYFSAGTHIAPPTNKQPSERRFSNFQYMLVPTSGMYDPTILGGKTGYTHEAMHTMSTAAVRNGRTLICTVMYSTNRNDKFIDTNALFDFGFDEFDLVTIPKEKFPGFSEKIMDADIQVGAVDFVALNDFTALVHNSADTDRLEIAYSHEYPFKNDENVSSYATFTLKSGIPGIPAELGKMDLEPSITTFELPQQERSFFSELTSKWWYWPLVILVSAVLIFAVFYSIRQINLYRKLKRRRLRLERIKQRQEALYSGYDTGTKW